MSVAAKFNKREIVSEHTRRSCPIRADRLVDGWHRDVVSHDLIGKTFSEIEAADKTVNLAELCREEDPNVSGIRIALDIILEALEQISFHTIDQIARSGQGPQELDRAVLWYGAKVSDLLARFRT